MTSCYLSCGMSSGLPGAASVRGNTVRHGLAFSKWELGANCQANSNQTGRGTDGSALWANELRAESDSSCGSAVGERAEVFIVACYRARHLNELLTRHLPLATRHVAGQHFYSSLEAQVPQPNRRSLSR